MRTVATRSFSGLAQGFRSESIFPRRLTHTTFFARFNFHTTRSAHTKLPSHIFTIMNGHTQPGTQSMDDLAASLKSFGISNVPQTSSVHTYPTFNQFDIYRSHITELLTPITGADPKIIYSALQWTQVLDFGDLMLPVPALRLKGKKPDELAKDIAEKVGMVV